MKIRTDFVTNSSSYSSAEIVIDNPLLLDILQRYKDMGVFGETEEGFDFEIGSRNGGYTDSDYYMGVTKTPAFFYVAYDNAPLNHPCSLDEVLQYMIGVMDWSGNSDSYNQEIYLEMKKELYQREEEIDDSYSFVIWRGAYSDNSEETYREGNWDFHYDSINGEKYSEEDDENDEEDDEDKVENKTDLSFYEATARDILGYGEVGNELDKYWEYVWEYANEIGYIIPFNDFPMDEYKKYVEIKDKITAAQKEESREKKDKDKL